MNEDDQANIKNGKQFDNGSPNRSCDKKTVKSSKQILKNAGQKSEFDSGMNNCQLNQNSTSRESRCGSTDDTTYCTPVYGQIVSSRENHNQINDIQQKFSTNEMTKPSSSFRSAPTQKSTQGWDEFSKRNLPKTDDAKKKTKSDKKMTNGKSHFDFFPVFDNKAVNDPENTKLENITNEDSKIIIDPMQKLVLHTTDNKLCDNKNSALSSFSS